MFLYIFIVILFLNEQFAHSLFFIQRFEGIAQVTH